MQTLWVNFNGYRQQCLYTKLNNYKSFRKISLMFLPTKARFGYGSCFLFALPYYFIALYIDIPPKSPFDLRSSSFAFRHSWRATSALNLSSVEKGGLGRHGLLPDGRCYRSGCCCYPAGNEVVLTAIYKETRPTRSRFLFSGVTDKFLFNQSSSPG